MDNKLYIKKIIRDDGVYLDFDAKEIYLAQENTLLVRPDPNTTAIEYTEADGGEMIRQHNSIYEQPINGLIIPKNTPYWDLRSRLSAFFQINHYYKIIYKKIDGGMFAVDKAWISAGLQIVPVPYENYSTWNITLSIGHADWTEYSETPGGEEIYTNVITLPLISAAAGGEMWNNVGLVADGVGEEWEGGSGGVQPVIINSTKNIYPVWTVKGPCVNPKLQNNTTDTYAEFNGTVAEGQTLTVNFAEGVAYLNTALVTRLVSGLVSLRPGENMVGFSSDGGTAKTTAAH